MARTDRPLDRVREAMRRLSRDKWLSPKETRDYTHSLLRHAVWTTPSIFLDRVYPDACNAVGMIRGLPPAFPGEAHYGDVLSLVRNHRKSDHRPMELKLLNLVRSKYENDR